MVESPLEKYHQQQQQQIQQQQSSSYQQHVQMQQQQQQSYKQQQCIQELKNEDEGQGKRGSQRCLISSEEQRIIDFVNKPEGEEQFIGVEVGSGNAQTNQKADYVDGLEGLCSGNELVEMLQTSATEALPKEGSPNVQSSNTTDSHFKLMTTTTTNPNLCLEDVLNRDKFLDDLLLSDTPNLQMDDIIQIDTVEGLQGLEHVPKMEDLEKFLISCDLISPELTSQGQQQSSMQMYNQQQAQIEQQQRTEFVPVSADSQRAAKKQKQVASPAPAYKNLKDVQSALTSTLHALDGQLPPSSTSNLYDSNINFSSMRRSTSYPFPFHTPTPNLGLYSSPNFSDNSFQSMANRSASSESFRQQLPPLNRQFVPTQNFGQVSVMPLQFMQNQQLGNKVDYSKGATYRRDMGGQVFYDPNTGRRLNPGPAFYKRQREEHANLQSIFQRFGNSISKSSPNMMGFHLQPRHKSLDGYSSQMNQRRGKSGGLVKEGVLDQIRSAGAQQWLKIDPNLHQLQYHQQQDAFNTSQNRLLQGRQIKQETPDMIDANHRANSCGIAQKVVTEATERGQNGRYSSGFTIESQLQKHMSGRIQYQGVSRDPWSAHFDAIVQDNKGQQQFLGGYANQIEAARAQDVGQVFFHMENGKTNFPKSEYTSVEDLRELGPSGFILEQKYESSGMAQNDPKYLGIRKAGGTQGYEAFYRDVEVPIFPNKQQQTSSLDNIVVKKEDPNL